LAHGSGRIFKGGRRLENIIKRNVYCLRKYLSLSKTIEKIREKEKQTE
jgi:hypothetical protein